MEKKSKKLFRFPNTIEIPNAKLDGSSAFFAVVSVGDFFCHIVDHTSIFQYRLLSGMLGIRLEIYKNDKFLGQFQYVYIYEAFADLMRFHMGDLELEFNEDHELIGKIYKHKEE